MRLVNPRLIFRGLADNLDPWPSTSRPSITSPVNANRMGFAYHSTDCCLTNAA